MLPVFLGHATRLVEYHLGDRKALPRDGLLRGVVDDRRPRGRADARDRAARPTRETVEAALPGFIGTISQRPPAYSAIKVAGRRAYAMARAGETVELAEREVTIHALDIVSWDGTRPGPADRGHRRRVLGRHVHPGARPRPRRTRSGSAAYLGALTRTASGPFTLDDGPSARRRPCRRGGGPGRVSCPLLRPIDAGLDAFPVVTLTADEVAAVARGQFVRPAGGLPGPAEHYRLRDAGGTLVAIATATGGRLAPDKVFVAPDPRPAPVG